MSTGGGDSLYLSCNNVISTDGWAKSISWTSVAFNAPGPAPSPLVIADLYMLTRKATGEGPGPLLWFVDIVKNPGSNLRLLERYYIEPDSSIKWVKHTLPDDVEEGSITSCLGVQNDSPNSDCPSYVDGIYTLGKIRGSESLLFTPTKNVWDPDIPPSSDRLGFPTGPAGRWRRALSSSSLITCMQYQHLCWSYLLEVEHGQFADSSLGSQLSGRPGIYDMPHWL